MKPETDYQHEEEMEPPSLDIGADMLPELQSAKPGQVFKLYVTAKVGQDGTLLIQEIENEDFKDKNYQDIVNEDMGTASEASE